jgi:surface antigen
MKGPNGITGHFGNAWEWAANAVVMGFVVNTTPSVGAIAYWGKSATISDGHVA